MRRTRALVYPTLDGRVVAGPTAVDLEGLGNEGRRRRWLGRDRRPHEVSASPHSTPLGAVALARLTVDPSLTLADAVIVTEPSRVVEPQWGALRAEEFLARWGRAADSVVERSER